jgi:hypothetical protein
MRSLDSHSSRVDSIKQIIEISPKTQALCLYHKSLPICLIEIPSAWSVWAPDQDLPNRNLEIPYLYALAIKLLVHSFFNCLPNSFLH